MVLVSTSWLELAPRSTLHPWLGFLDPQLDIDHYHLLTDFQKKVGQLQLFVHLFSSWPRSLSDLLLPFPGQLFVFLEKLWTLEQLKLFVHLSLLCLWVEFCWIASPDQSWLVSSKSGLYACACACSVRSAAKSWQNSFHTECSHIEYNRAGYFSYRTASPRESYSRAGKGYTFRFRDSLRQTIWSTSFKAEERGSPKSS